MDTLDIIDGICNIPEGTQTIGAFAFEGCTDLKVVNIPASVEDISDRAFDNCKSLSNIKIGKNTKFDIETTFKGCPNAEKNGLYDSFRDNFFDGIEREEKSISK